MKHMNASDNALRRDDDGFKGFEDRVTPIAFRQDGNAVTTGVDPMWFEVDSDSTVPKNAIFDFMEDEGFNVYTCERLINAGGIARPGRNVIILGDYWRNNLTNNVPESTFAHEWLHAFKNRRHIDVEDNIMWGDHPPPGDAVDVNGDGDINGEDMGPSGHGGNVSADQYNDFIN